MIKKILTAMMVLSLFIIAACENVELITIDFMIDGSIYQQVKIDKGSKVERPNDPVKSGYEFDNWYYELEDKVLFDFDQPILYSTTVYGRYELLSESPTEELTIYYINDLHGAILKEDSSLGLASLANVVLEDKTNNPDSTLFLGGGDLLQGQIISNYYDGASVIDILNDMKMDAFVMGNHEFDWGLEEVTQYFNGKNSIQANFPLLGANIYKKETNQLADDIDEYVVIEKQGLKIGIIGTIGSGLESSISYPRIKDYEFIDPIEKTASLAKHLRTNEDADIVIAIHHEDDSSYNFDITALKGDSKVDAVFNGHTHNQYAKKLNNKPVLQSGANGANLGKVVLNIENGVVTSSSAINLNRSNETRLQTEHPLIKEKVDMYLNEIEHLYDIILVSDNNYSKDELAYYLTDLMIAFTGADVAVHNFGGTRASINRNEEISYSKLFQISPFDNTIVKVEVLGRDLLNIISGNAASYKSGLQAHDISPSRYYMLATNDYIFGKSAVLRDSSDVEYTGVTILDMSVEAVENQKNQGYAKFSLSNPISFYQSNF